MIYLILVVSLITRLIGVNQSLWLDEATSANVVSEFSIREIFQYFISGDFHPPLYYSLLKLWTNIFGYSELGLRSLSVLFGVATVYLVYKIARHYINNNNALIAPILLATSGLHIYYSQEARMYSMATFFTTLLIYAFIKTLGTKVKTPDWLMLSISLFGVAASYYLSGIMVALVWVISVFGKKNIFWWKKFLVANIPLLLFIIFWKPFFMIQLGLGLGVEEKMSSWWNILGRFSLKEVFLIPTKFILGRVSIQSDLIYGIVASFLIAVFFLIISVSLKNIKNNYIIWIWFCVPIVVAIALSYFVPVLTYFRLLFTLPAFYLLLAFGINELKAKRLIPKLLLIFIITVNVVSSGVYLLSDRFHREDWKGLVSYIKNDLYLEHTEVVFPSNSQQEAFKYYAKRLGLEKQPIQSKLISFKDTDTVLFVRYVQEISDPKDLSRLQIEKMGYHKNTEMNFRGVLVWKYTK